MQSKNHYHLLDETMTAFLRSLWERPDRHAKFLNTLSLLEHIGSRKIMLSQSGTGMNMEKLQHLAEEARHAFFFRRAAERVGGRAMSYDENDILAKASAHMYFERLDAQITEELGKHDHALAYYYVTMAVELRAEWLYNLYETLLEGSGVKISLKSVIAEEDSHLAEMKKELSALDEMFDKRLERFVAIEAQLFEKWFGSVCEAVKE